MRRIVALGIALAVVPAALVAQSTARTTVDTTRMTVGDRVRLTVSVDHPAGTTVRWPDSVDLSPFEVLDARALAPTTEGGRVRSEAVFTLTAFELGELEIPSLEVAVEGGADGPEMLRTDRYGIEVTSVGADESGDIRDIKGPVGAPLPVLLVAVLALLAMLVGAGLYAAYRRYRARGSEETAGRKVGPPRPAHEVALEALATLEASSMLERGQVKEYHIEVSEILRRYVEARFYVPALEMTTWEVLDGLERAVAEAGFRDGLARFLERCDLVKFAKVRPTAEASHEVLALGRSLVERTVPRFEEPSETGVTASPAASPEVP